MKLYQKIKTEMTVKEMARFICQMSCKGCALYDGWRNCHKTTCQNHAANGYKHMIEILQSEV